MCQTLFFIPHEFLGLPVFGFGWLLGLWVVISVVWVGWLVLQHGWNSDVTGLLPFLAIVATAVGFVLPNIEVLALDGRPLGLPIRGYGTLMLCAVVAGWWLAARRAKRVGIVVDTIASLGFWVFIAGIIGARLFFVIEYRQDFLKPTWRDTVLEIVKFTEGGLVVYGSLVGGFLAFVAFSWKHQIPAFKLGDIIAPGVVLGMAIGRLGCLMNGCCYGGLSEQGGVGLTFPRLNSVEQGSISPPYQHQLVTGRLHGFVLAKHQPIVQSVQPNSPAAKAGLTAGLAITKLNGRETPDLSTLQRELTRSGPELTVELSDKRRLNWTVGELPQWSLPVHPVQIYSAISSALICCVLLASEPFWNRTGAVMASLLSLYPPIRFVEEMIRDDEPGQFGTGLTISQWVSVAVLLGAVLTWALVVRTPRRIVSTEGRPVV